VKRVLAWFAGLVGIAALGRLLARRRRAAQTAPVPPPPAAVEQGAVAAAADGDPADELRRKLAETREAEAETGADPGPAAESLEERRARVHAKARAAIDAMSEESAE
jgi:hypothetical protein